MTLSWTAKKIPGQKSKRYDALIEQLLQPYGLWQASEDWWRCSCPLHKGDNPSAFSINKWGRWRCFVKCGSGNIEMLLIRLLGLNHKQVKEYIEKLPPTMTSVEGIVLPPWDERNNRGKEKYDVLKEAAIAAYRGLCPSSLVERGFSRDSLKTHSIGYDQQNYRVVIPVRDYRGKLVGVTYRRDFEGDGPKYWHDHFDKSMHLFGLHLCKQPIKRLHLVEGQLDRVRMWQLGLDSAAIMGSSLSGPQLDLLIKIKCDQIALAFDNDEAGEKCTREAIQKLIPTRYGRTLQLAVYPTKDPGELESPGQVRYMPWTKLIGKLTLPR